MNLQNGSKYETSYVAIRKYRRDAVLGIAFVLGASVFGPHLLRWGGAVDSSRFGALEVYLILNVCVFFGYLRTRGVFFLNGDAESIVFLSVFGLRQINLHGIRGVRVWFDRESDKPVLLDILLFRWPYDYLLVMNPIELREYLRSSLREEGKYHNKRIFEVADRSIWIHLYIRHISVLGVLGALFVLCFG